MSLPCIEGVTHSDSAPGLLSACIEVAWLRARGREISVMEIPLRGIATTYYSRSNCWS